jgi:hypothetical protein
VSFLAAFGRDEVHPDRPSSIYMYREREREISIQMHMCMHIYVEREREREREIGAPKEIDEVHLDRSIDL